LVRKELIRPERSELAAGDAFKFRHILIRDAAYEALPKAERATMHERVADWLERTVGERLAEYEEIVGYHLEAAHRYRIELGETGDKVMALAARAGAHLAAAGGRALDRGDMATAVILLGRATRAYPVASPARLRLIPDLSYALFSIGRRPEAVQLLGTAKDEATAAGETQLAIWIDLERAFLAILTDGFLPRAARETAEASIPVLARVGDDLGLARAYLVLAMAAWSNGRIEAAIEARRLAIDHAAVAGNPRIAQRHAFWGAECYGPTPAIAAIARLEGSLATAPGDPMRRAEALFTLAGLYAMRGRTEEARHAYRAVKEILEELGASWWAAAAFEIGGVAELALDDPVRAEQWIREGVDQLGRLGATGLLTFLLGLQSIALARQGKAQAALEIADRVMLGHSPEDVVDLIFAQSGRSIALCVVGDLPEAVAAAREATRIADATDWTMPHALALMALAEALGASGEPLEAAQVATRALELCAAKEDLMGEQRAGRFLAALR
jgi:tetratricopeptide (TPR) repeat protein